MAATRLERKETITKKRQQQILDAALQVFSEKGFAEASTAEIARVAGVAQGTIFHYYPTKRELLVSLLSTYVVEPAVELLRQPPESDDAPFLISVIERQLSFAFENADTYWLLFTEVHRDPELRRQYFERALLPALNLFERYLKERVVSGVFRHLNADVTVHAVVAMIMGFMVFYRLEGKDGFSQSVPRRELATELVDLILKGIQK